MNEQSVGRSRENAARREADGPNALDQRYRLARRHERLYIERLRDERVRIDTEVQQIPQRVHDIRPRIRDNPAVGGVECGQSNRHTIADGVGVLCRVKKMTAVREEPGESVRGLGPRRIQGGDRRRGPAERGDSVDGREIARREQDHVILTPRTASPEGGVGQGRAVASTGEYLLELPTREEADLPAVRRPERVGAALRSLHRAGVHRIQRPHPQPDRRVGVPGAEREQAPVRRHRHRSQLRVVAEIESDFLRREDGRTQRRRVGRVRAAQQRHRHGQQRCAKRCSEDPRDEGCPSRPDGRGGWRGRVRKARARLFEYDARLADIAQAPPGVLLQTPLEQAADRSGRLRWQPRPVGFLLDHASERLHDALAGKAPTARQHFVQNSPERPDICTAIDGSAGCLFGRHVCSRSEYDASTGVLGSQGGRVGVRCQTHRVLDESLGEAEVQQLQLAFWRDLHVGGLEIAVHDPAFVRVFERLGELAGDGEDLGLRHLHARPRRERDHVSDSVPLNELHHDCARFDGVDARDIRMIQRRQQMRFAGEARHPVGVLNEDVKDDFDRDIAAQFRVRRAIHRAHTALTNLRGDAIVGDGGWVHVSSQT